MESSISGFKERGDWETIVEHGEKIESALRTVAEETEYPVPEESLEEFTNWRPKLSDNADDKKIADKTSEQASIGEGKGEQKGANPIEDVEKAAGKLEDSFTALEKDQDIQKTKASWKESTNYMTRATDTTGRRFIRRIEKFVYKHIMTQISPYYFDNQLVSSNIQEQRNGEYVFEVNINDDELKTHMKRILGRLDDEDRWHLDTEDLEVQEDVIELSDEEVEMDDIHTPSMESDKTKDIIKEEFENSEEELDEDSKE